MSCPSNKVSLEEKLKVTVIRATSEFSSFRMNYKNEEFRIQTNSEGTKNRPCKSVKLIKL